MVVNFKYFYKHCVTNINNIFYLFCALNIKTADVNKSLFARSDFNESTKAHKTSYNTIVDCADFWVFCDKFNNCQCAFCIVNVDT